MSDITKTRYTEEYKQYRRDYMKAYRKRNKSLNDTPHNPLWKKKGERIFSDNTKKQYIRTILRIHQKLQVNIHRDLEETLEGLFSNKEITDNTTKYIKKQLSYIFNRNFTTTMKELYPNKTSLKIMLIPFTTLASFFNDERFKKLYNHLSSFIIDLNKEYEVERDDNELNDEDKDKIITDYSEETLLSHIEKLKKPIDKVIFGVYTLIPPRRLEYNKVFIATETSYRTNKLNNDNNYIIKSKGKFIKFVWNDYKTARAYGRVEVVIPDILEAIISDYVKKNKLKTGDILIPISRTNFTRYIVKVFKEVYKSNMSVRFLRMSYATYISKLDISNNEKNKLCISMGHSLQQSGKYKKII